MVKWLVEHGAVINAETRANYTALHQAAQQGAFKSFKIFIFKSLQDIITLFVIYSKMVLLQI